VSDHAEWVELADAVDAEDRPGAGAYNARAETESKLQVELGPIPYFGAIAHAPLVLLIAHPAYNGAAKPGDHAFHRSGWPLAALHPEAPPGMRAWWQMRLSQLIALFDPRSVATAVAAIPLTPWASRSFDRELRLPSRRRMLAFAASAASRGALLVTMREPALWTESPEIAALPRWQNLLPRSWRATRVDRENLGDAAWSLLCHRIAAHIEGR
jgi:hypothetical protein